MRTTWKQRIHGALLSAILLCTAVTAKAENFAVLVGVSSYPTLKEQQRLSGPRNDVQRLLQVLRQRGFAPGAISVLADGVDGAQQPTRANILAALGKRTAQVKRGDTLMIYFAGHGSQQPADRKTAAGREEPDGLFEIFLPIDVGAWDGRTGQVRNAIVDHELRQLVDQASATGAFVWGVFDACHSATLVRGGGPDAEVRFRHVNPTELGIPTEALDQATAEARKLRDPAQDAEAARDRSLTGEASTATRGGTAFFYAAQTTELTPEMRLPLEDPNRMTYGLFSFMLTRALESGTPMTYRQMAQYILGQYAGIHEARVTPLFSGSALDQMVLGTTSRVIRQWPVGAGKLQVPVGSLGAVAEGAIFALLPSPTATQEQALGFLRAKRVELAQSDLEPIALQGKPVPDPTQFKPGQQARLVQSPERLNLRVAVDARACGSPCVWQSVVDGLKSQGVPGADIQWVTQAADVLLSVSDARITALSPTQQGAPDCSKDRPCAPAQRGTDLLVRSGSRAGGDTEAEIRHLAASLHGMARLANLMRLAARVSVEAQSRQVRLDVRIRHKGSAEPSAITPDKVATLEAGDKVEVKIRNDGDTAADVTLLYLDARAGVSALFPSGAGEVNRLEPRSERLIDDLDVTDNDGVAGLERLLLIAVQAEKQTERADFSFLAQPPLQALVTHRGATGAAADDMEAFMDAAFAHHRTRGIASPKSPSSRTGMQSFTFQLKVRAP